MKLEILQVGGSIRVPGAIEQAYSTVCYLTDGKRHILIDPGDYVSLNFLEERFEDVGISPEDITDVVLTHIHLDHAYATRFFPNATIHVHPAYKDKPFHKFGTFKSKLYIEMINSWKTVNLINAGTLLFGSIKVFHTPWHAKEHCSFLIDTENMGRVLYTGDIVMTRVEFYEIFRWLRKDDCARFVNRLGSRSDYIIFTHDEYIRSADYYSARS
ncbi:MBL fold metallo-hydrolase [Fervidobacterium thailandense]|uniref:MBL fold metallo-hydrolase n=1 Tax=Fervidobacterium thailandense TaxID=1008305 RepID=A0A1E3G2P3_9BACT|nr:MBL fold metallo-hydrolase [Fervidobacterium thailandense]ODN29928.1 MBL fold metallo-hydrolase [Fervidobacterium thailandense]